MQADLRLCWSHIPHCWKSHVAAHIYIETKSMDLSNLSKFINFNISLRIVFILANSADPDEMPP